MLSLDRIDVVRGRTRVLRGMSLSVGEGEIVSLVGANGAGKTTTLLAISGLIPIASGSAFYRSGKRMLDLRRSRPAEIVRAGLVHAPEGRQVFGRLTVAENLELGAYCTNSARARRALEEVYGRFPVLAERQRQRAGSLSGGEQMMLALGRALMAAPKLLLLDEPSLGLSPRITEEVFDLIVSLNRDLGVAVLLVEQNAMLALGTASRAYVLETGRVVRQGAAAEVRADPAIAAAYLGLAPA
jgi:branched-chain amino acid transport system ATP-binding protein